MTPCIKQWLGARRLAGYERVFRTDIMAEFHEASDAEAGGDVHVPPTVDLGSSYYWT